VEEKPLRIGAYSIIINLIVAVAFLVLSTLAAPHHESLVESLVESLAEAAVCAVLRV